MCKTHCIVWNNIDKDCEIYGEHHPCPRRCPYYQTHTAFQHVKEIDRMRDTLTEKEKQTERLQEQLKEANEVIIYANNVIDAYKEIDAYLEKWGLK